MIILVHPITEDLRFLKKTIRKLRVELENKINCFTLSNNLKSHENFLSKLKSSSDDSLVIFFCHGTSNKIYGCSYRHNLSNHPKRYVHEENKKFIDVDNLALLSNKKVISLSCNSEQLAAKAIDNGVKVFVSFNEINFDQKIYIENRRTSKRVIARTKWLLRRSIYWSLIKSYHDDLTFSEFKFLLKFSLKNLSTNLISKKKTKYNIRSSYCLNEIINGIKIVGDAGLKLFG